MTAPSGAIQAGLLLGPALLTGFFLAGHFATLRIPSPARGFTSVLGSLILLYATLIVCDLASIPVTLASMAAGLGTAAAIGWLFAGRFRTAALAIPPFTRPRLLTCAVVLLAAAGLGSVVARTVVEPLAGWDNAFRWNHLALAVRHTGGLDFYPPVSSADFFLYPWCDGIPPLVSVCNLWVYLFTGSTEGALVAGRVFVELVLIGALVWRIANRLWGESGSRVSLLVLASSPLFLFSTSLGQETGLSAVALLLMTLFLLEHRTLPSISTAVWTGLAAGTAALVRDYNLIFIPVAVGLLTMQRAPRHHLAACFGAGALLAATWYVRNGLRTGNLLFPHDLGGLLPTNAFHAGTMSSIGEAFGLPPGMLIVRSLPLLGFGAGLALALAPWGAWKAGRAGLPPLAIAATLFGLWWVSVPSTAGGLTYSTRVLGAAIPLLCILAGWAGAHLRSRFAWTALLVLAALLIADSARRSWSFLQKPALVTRPWDWTAWQTARHQPVEARADAFWRFLVTEAKGRVILCDQPKPAADHALEPGARVATLFSPLALPITDGNRPRHFSTVIRDLLRNDVRFVVLAEDLWTNLPSLRDRSALRLFYQTVPMIHFKNLRVYDLDFLRDELTRLGLYQPLPE